MTNQAAGQNASAAYAAPAAYSHAGDPAYLKIALGSVIARLSDAKQRENGLRATYGNQVWSTLNKRDGLGSKELVPLKWIPAYRSLSYSESPLL